MATAWPAARSPQSMLIDTPSHVFAATRLLGRGVGHAGPAGQGFPGSLTGKTCPTENSQVMSNVALVDAKPIAQLTDRRTVRRKRPQQFVAGGMSQRTQLSWAGRVDDAGHDPSVKTGCGLVKPPDEVYA